ncbi:hypothetical protein NIIDNTM18_25430 [Mycolicibacterium litorale]|uniref:Uncharacterized protein n=1 Tax=Mycolicibacterium litorale TaxID=758802 RepID=A0A6S6P423_9MYCO|nr:hypothetical protein NIIDNTM18_25430 [Mycolicibacterium litorale]
MVRGLIRMTGAAPPKVNANCSGEGTKVTWSMAVILTRRGRRCSISVPPEARHGNVTALSPVGTRHGEDDQ